MAAPFLFYVYEYAPDDPNIKVWETSWFSISNGGYNTVQGYIYIVSTKAFIFFIVSTWYLTCTHWWKHTILVPLTLVLYQFTGAINNSVSVVDNFSPISSIPLVLPILILHIIIARKLRFFNKTIDAAVQIENELNEAYLND